MLHHTYRSTMHHKQSPSTQDGYMCMFDFRSCRRVAQLPLDTDAAVPCIAPDTHMPHAVHAVAGHTAFLVDTRQVVYANQHVVDSM